MFYCNTFYGTSKLFWWTYLLDKNPCCKELASPCTDYFHQNHPSSTENTYFPYSSVSRILLSIVCFLPQPQYNFHFPPCFPFPPTVLCFFCLFSITCGMFVCLYKLLLLLDFKMHLLLCLLYLLGCICTALTVNLFCLSRKLFLTAITPDGLLSIFLQLLKKLTFLKPCEFFLRVLHNSMYSTISFPSIFCFPSCFSFC